LTVLRKLRAGLCELVGHRRAYWVDMAWTTAAGQRLPSIEILFCPTCKRILQ
jgi:hypothetical protein